MRKAVRSAKKNVAHADLMIAFLRHKKELEPVKENQGKIGMKIAQLEDSRDEEIRFINFAKNQSASDIDMAVNA